MKETNKTHKDYNIGDVLIYDLPPGCPHTKVIYYISEKSQHSKNSHYQFRLIRIDAEPLQWPLYYKVLQLNSLCAVGYKHYRVVK
jgi:hypothetical protein